MNNDTTNNDQVADSTMSSPVRCFWQQVFDDVFENVANGDKRSVVDADVVGDDLASVVAWLPPRHVDRGRR